MKIATSFEVIKGKIQLFDSNGNKLPSKGTHWGGSFNCKNNKLTSLEGAPESVGGYFYCSNNQLTSLEGAPESVGGYFDCYNNQLTSLEGAPESVGGSFDCSNNQLTSLEGAPESVGGYFDCSNNQLTSLAGAPESVGGGFNCKNNNLTSLEGAPESVGRSFDCNNNNLTSLEGAPESVGGYFDCYNNQLTSLEGAPESVGGYFDCSNNQITSLAGAPKERQPMFSAFLCAGFVFADGILTRKKSQRKISAEVTLYKTEKLGFKKNSPVVFVATDGNNFAHGDSAKAALEELAFKTNGRDTSQYSGMALDTKKTPDEWAFVYRTITGACQYGTKEFMSRRELKKKYTLAEIIEQTKGAFGHESFKAVVGGK
jgi:hypothetical protein